MSLCDNVGHQCGTVIFVNVNDLKHIHVAFIEYKAVYGYSVLPKPSYNLPNIKVCEDLIG